jgi:SAM-dependent methyltransferase
MPDGTLPRTESDRLALGGSFGGIAAHYERYRPGPALEAIDWYVPHQVSRVVDLGAGTGALSRLLVGRADEVVAVEPDDRMRRVLAAEVAGVTVLPGTGEAIPLGDSSADAIIASTSWHWMDPIRALDEVARVLVPGGCLGALWTGPDPNGAFLAQARAHTARSGASNIEEFTGLVNRSVESAEDALMIPDGAPFDPPEQVTFAWDIALDADELIGLLGTFSWIIALPDDRQAALLGEARELLTAFGIEGATTVDIAWRTQAWRARRHGANGVNGRGGTD